MFLGTRSAGVLIVQQTKGGPFAEWQTGFAASAGFDRSAYATPWADHLAAVSTLMTGERSGARRVARRLLGIAYAALPPPCPRRLAR